MLRHPNTPALRIGIITDEISPDFEEALVLGVSWGLRDFELRTLNGRRVPQLTAGEIQRLLRLQKERGLRFTALSPGAFKGTIHERERLEHELQETLPQTYQLARLFRAPVIIVFGCKRAANDASGDRQRVVAVLSRAAASARQHGLTLAVENEPGFWCDTGTNTAQMLAQCQAPNLRANWDPANAFGLNEEPFPQGYEALKPWIANVHVKDTRAGTLAACVPLGEGKVDWRAQLQALARDQLVAHVTLETHCAPLRENSRRNLEHVRALLGGR